MDLAKVEAVEAWPWPLTARALRGVPGLDRILPEVHRQLWRCGGALDSTLEAQGVLLDTGGRWGVVGPQKGADDGAPAPAS